MHVLAPSSRAGSTEIAGMRDHGTTHRRPLEVFEPIERAALLAVPQRRGEPVVWQHRRRVHRDCHVLLDGACTRPRGA